MMLRSITARAENWTRPALKVSVANEFGNSLLMLNDLLPLRLPGLHQYFHLDLVVCELRARGGHRREANGRTAWILCGKEEKRH
jgi:hypothetical protein